MCRTGTFPGSARTLHGHNYVMEVVVADDIDQAAGYLLDLKLLSDIITRQVVRDVEHRNLNTDVPWLKGRVPSVEDLARAFRERLRPGPELRRRYTAADLGLPDDQHY